MRCSSLNEKWLTDITEFQVPAGKVYLSHMMDCFDGVAISWLVGIRLGANFLNTILDAQLLRR